MKQFDIGIIGSGVAGCFAALRLVEKHPEAKVIMFDIGAGPGKRRRQLEGWLGCLPQSDGKFYNDLTEVKKITSGRKVRYAWDWFFSKIEEATHGSLKLVQASKPQVSLQKKLQEKNYSYQTHDFYQWRPDSIHQLSKNISENIEENTNIQFSFDTEIFRIAKKKNLFILSSTQGDFTCKKILVATGRSGWRWVSEMYQSLGLAGPDNVAQVGVRVELAGQYVKEFNKSHCSLQKEDLYLGPFCWNGTIIAEDHADLVLSGFRSNEDRWKSEKVSFSLTKKISAPQGGIHQMDRLAKLAFLLFNDRVSRERIKVFLRNESQLNLLPEFSWLGEAFQELSFFIPQLSLRGYYHVPEVIPRPLSIQTGENLESTELPGMFIAGENLGIFGLTNAALTGILAADAMVKDS